MHDLRKEARRLQVRLELSNAVLDDTASRKATRMVVAQLRLLGPLRDTQVQLKRLRAPEGPAPGLHSLLHYLKRRRRHFARKARKQLKKRGLDGRVLAIQANLTVWPRSVGAERQSQLALRRAVSSSWRMVIATRAKAKAGGKGLHRARIALKHYSLISDVLPSPRIVPAAKGRKAMMQRLAMLGDVHDLDVLQVRISKFSRKRAVTLESRIALRDFRERSRADAQTLIARAYGTRTAAPSNRPARRSARA